LENFSKIVSLRLNRNVKASGTVYKYYFSAIKVGVYLLTRKLTLEWRMQFPAESFGDFPFLPKIRQNLDYVRSGNWLIFSDNFTS